MKKESTHSVDHDDQAQTSPSPLIPLRRTSGEVIEIPTARQRDSNRTIRRRSATNTNKAAAAAAGKYRRFKTIDSGHPFDNADVGQSGKVAKSAKVQNNPRQKSSDAPKTAMQQTPMMDKTQNEPTSPPTAAAPESAATAVLGVANKTNETVDSKDNKKKKNRKKDSKKKEKEKEKGKKKKKKTKNGKAPVDEKEHFDNEAPEFNYESPDSKSPTISESRIHDCIHDVQLSGSHYTWENSFMRMAVLFSCTFGYLNYFRFPYLMFKYGGIFFLIPYGVCLCLIGMPLTTLELAIGQYTSLPPTTLFARLAPCYLGVGYTMMLIKIITTWFSFDARILYDWISSAILLSVDLSRTTTCVGSFARDCFKPFLKCGTNQPYHDQCFDVSTDLSNNAITFEQAMVILSSGSAALRRNQVQIFTDNEFFQMGGIFSITSCFATIVMVLIVFVNGPRYFGRISVITSIISIVSILFLAIFLMIQKGGETWSLLWPGDYTKLYDWHTWKNAALGVMFSLSLGDGTLIQISSMSKFNNNIIRDVMFIVITDIFMSLITSMVTLPLMLHFKDLLYPQILEADFSIHEIISLFGDDWPAVVHSFLIPFYSNFQFGLYMALIITTSFYFANIGTLVITAEVVLSTFYHSFPVLLSLDQRYFRHFFGVVFMLAFLLFLLITPNRLYTTAIKQYVTNFVIEPLTPLIVFIEVLALMHHYRFRRFMINMRSMIGYNPNNCIWNLSFMQWVIILPFLLFVTLVASLWTEQWKYFRKEVVIGGYALTALISSLILWGVTISVLWTKYKGRNLRMLFEPHKSWGPQLSDDRNRAEFDERAARVRQ